MTGPDWAAAWGIVGLLQLLHQTNVLSTLVRTASVLVSEDARFKQELEKMHRAVSGILLVRQYRLLVAGPFILGGSVAISAWDPAGATQWNWLSWDGLLSGGVCLGQSAAWASLVARRKRWWLFGFTRAEKELIDRARRIAEAISTVATREALESSDSIMEKVDARGFPAFTDIWNEFDWPLICGYFDVLLTGDSPMGLYAKPAPMPLSEAFLMLGERASWERQDFVHRGRWRETSEDALVHLAAFVRGTRWPPFAEDCLRRYAEHWMKLTGVSHKVALAIQDLNSEQAEGS